MLLGHEEDNVFLEASRRSQVNPVSGWVN